MSLVYVAVATAVISAGSAVYSADANRKAQHNAADVARKNAEDAATQADIQTNAANQKSPDISAMLSANEKAAKGGVGGTMLTGAGGVDPSLLQLGKNTLLGGG